MTEPVALPDPSARIEAAFRAILETRMRGLPVLNPAVEVEAVGFRAWEGHWLGMLVTPWFINLMLLPLEPERWRPLALGVRSSARGQGQQRGESPAQSQGQRLQLWAHGRGGGGLRRREQGERRAMSVGCGRWAMMSDG